MVAGLTGNSGPPSSSGAGSRVSSILASMQQHHLQQDALASRASAQHLQQLQQQEQQHRPSSGQSAGAGSAGNPSSRDLLFDPTAAAAAAGMGFAVGPWGATGPGACASMGAGTSASGPLFLAQSDFGMASAEAHIMAASAPPTKVANLAPGELERSIDEAAHTGWAAALPGQISISPQAGSPAGGAGGAGGGGAGGVAGTSSLAQAVASGPGPGMGSGMGQGQGFGPGGLLSTRRSNQHFLDHQNLGFLDALPPMPEDPPLSALPMTIPMQMHHGVRCSYSSLQQDPQLLGGQPFGGSLAGSAAAAATARDSRHISVPMPLESLLQGYASQGGGTRGSGRLGRAATASTSSAMNWAPEAPPLTEATMQRLAPIPPVDTRFCPRPLWGQVPVPDMPPPSPIQPKALMHGRASTSSIMGSAGGGGGGAGGSGSMLGAAANSSALLNTGTAGNGAEAAAAAASDGSRMRRASSAMPFPGAGVGSAAGPGSMPGAGGFRNSGASFEAGPYSGGQTDPDAGASGSRRCSGIPGSGQATPGALDGSSPDPSHHAGSHMHMQAQLHAEGRQNGHREVDLARELDVLEALSHGGAHMGAHGASAGACMASVSDMAWEVGSMQQIMGGGGSGGSDAMEGGAAAGSPHTGTAGGGGSGGGRLGSGPMSYMGTVDLMLQSTGAEALELAATPGGDRRRNNGGYERDN